MFTINVGTIAQLVEPRLVIQKLLAPSSIPELAMPISDWDQAVYPLRWPSLTKNLLTEPKKGALRWCG